MPEKVEMLFSEFGWIEHTMIFGIIKTAHKTRASYFNVWDVLNFEDK